MSLHFPKIEKYVYSTYKVSNAADGENIILYDKSVFYRIAK